MLFTSSLSFLIRKSFFFYFLSILLIQIEYFKRVSACTSCVNESVSVSNLSSESNVTIYV